MLVIFHCAICLQMKSQYSLLCGKKWVPEVILATVEPPSRLPVRGSGVFIQARVCRARQKATGENDALAVSEALPFLEYEIARQLMLKLKVLGRNAAFSLKSEIDVGPQLLIATTTGTYHICISPHFCEMIPRTHLILPDSYCTLLRRDAPPKTAANQPQYCRARR